MPHYMFQGGYTAETWARLTNKPEDREATIRALLERHGGKLQSLYFTFGQDDFVAIGELPDNATASSLAIAVAASGSMRNFRTTPLITAQEAMQAMSKASQMGYPPPGR